jgi:integrase
MATLGLLAADWRFSMPHFPKPFFRSARSAWFVQIGARQINLGADRELAFARYHELMARPEIPTPPITASQFVVGVVDAFLDYVEKHRSTDTFRWYKDKLELFCNAIPPTLTVQQLKPFHVQKWIDSKPHVASGTRRNYCRAIMRAMRWAEEQGYVERSPLGHFKKPPAGRREQLVSAEQFSKILAHTWDQEFRDLLMVSWETGCRPQESLRVEARHVDVAGTRWVFPATEAKGGKQPRVIYLTSVAFEITQRLLAGNHEGPLFRNTDGLRWTPDATNCRFQTLKRKLGVKFSLYSLRHTWMNRLLVGGVDAFTVAILAGHSDPSMLAKHYQHLSQNPGFLLEQARRVSA